MDSIMWSLCTVLVGDRQASAKTSIKFQLNINTANLQLRTMDTAKEHPFCVTSIPFFF